MTKVLISVTIMDVPAEADYCEVTTEEVQSLAYACAIRPMREQEPTDQEMNAQRLAEQVVYRAFRKLEARDPNAKILTLALTGAERRKVVANWLRRKAPTLVRKTLYHPEHTLTGWANDLDPTPEQIADGHDDFPPLNELPRECPVCAIPRIEPSRPDMFFCHACGIEIEVKANVKPDE